MTRFITFAGAFTLFTLFGGALWPIDATADFRVTRRAYVSAERVSIEFTANGQFISVQPNGTLTAASKLVGTAERFELYDLGNGLLALKSAANGKYVTAHRAEPLAATGDAVGDSEVFRWIGGSGDLVRLRAVDARTFVCVEDGGAGLVSATNRCGRDAQLLRIRPVQSAPLIITAPAPESTLLSTAITFQWEGPGDEFSLNVGSAPGTSDLHASGSLGASTQETVNGLPLNGMTLYVELRRRMGTLEDVLNVRYTAAVRKGLCIIADFADRRLEDWAGAGVKNSDELSVLLRGMEDHWTWLSRGLEKFQWDTIRVRLSEPASPTAFPTSVAFREAVIALAAQQVSTSDFDVNNDGVIDTSWVIVSSGNLPVPYATGGASRNGGANLFVDGQASRSVAEGRIGNFNHEVGHNLGLPDLYGTFTTVSSLTLMADSWPLPPRDFTAYERTMLGWLHPQVISRTTDVWLSPAHETLAAIKVPTRLAAEYFMIEYRYRPSTGYGSGGTDFNGLAVYHVLEGSLMSHDPPLLKLEPADGSITPNEPLDPNDFVYPQTIDNPTPFVFRSYVADAPEIFRIENVSWRDGGLAFSVVVPETAPPLQNLLVNGSFEDGQSDTPDAWTAGAEFWAGATFVWPSPVAFDGERSAHLEAMSANYMWWSQDTYRLYFSRTYLACGWLKGERLVATEGKFEATLTANLGIAPGEPRGLDGTFDWTQRCVPFVANTPKGVVRCNLGAPARRGLGTGKLWCDDFNLVELRSAF